MKKIRKYGVLIKHNKQHSLDELTDLISQLVGYETTQAMSCAFITIKNGEYMIKKYTAGDLQKAEELVRLSSNYGLSIKLVPM